MYIRVIATCTTPTPVQSSWPEVPTFDVIVVGVTIKLCTYVHAATFS